MTGPSASSGSGLVLNGTNSTLNVTFDRPMQASTFTASDVLQIVGPIGSITDPQFYPAPASSINQPIPDRNVADGFGTVSTLTVPDFAGTFKVAKITVQLDLSHTNLSDLSAVLISPGGPNRSRCSEREPALSGQNLTGTILDDSAQFSITTGVAPYTRVVPVHDEGPLRAQRGPAPVAPGRSTSSIPSRGIPAR